MSLHNIDWTGWCCDGNSDSEGESILFSCTSATLLYDLEGKETKSEEGHWWPWFEQLCRHKGMVHWDTAAPLSVTACLLNVRMCNSSSIRLEMSFFVVLVEERGRGQTLGWSWSLNQEFCFWMNLPQDWMHSLLYLLYSYWKSNGTYYF